MSQTKKNQEVSRRAFLQAMGRSGALCAALAMTGCAGFDELLGGDKVRKRPNIVFMIADDERWDMMSCSGNPYFETPNRDRLAAEGMRFENAFVTSAVCSPSRGSFLTGKHVHQCGTQPIIHMNNTFHRSERPFPARLHDVGYHAAHFGKWHLGEGDKQKPGYDHWVGYYALTPFFNPIFTTNGEPKQYEGYSDFLLADMASEHIKQVANDDQPFCVYVAFGSPHYDFSYPEKLEHTLDGVEIEDPPSVHEDVLASGKPNVIRNSPLRFDNLSKMGAHDHNVIGDLDNMRRRYMRSSLSLDESVGKIMDALDEAGVADDTIVIYTSDHGHMLGEHGLGAKHLPYEESVRVPMIVRYPRMIKPGGVNTDLVSNIDIAPTLLDLGGAPIPDDVAGDSMRPLMESRHKSVKGWKEEYAFLHETTVAVRTHEWKLIHHRHVNEWELYDLKNDPYEITNLYGKPEYATAQAEMERRLERQLQTTDFPEQLHAHITKPWMLGPFSAEEAEAVTAAALSAGQGAQSIVANGKKYEWTRAGDPTETMLPAYRQAEWMWDDTLVEPGKSVDAQPGKVYFRQEIELPADAKAETALVQTAADNGCSIFVNGQHVANVGAWMACPKHDIANLLKPGKNVIGVIGDNAGDKPNPGGVLMGGEIKLANGKTLSIMSGKGWQVTRKPQAQDWSTAAYDASGWQLSLTLGAYDMAPWNVGKDAAIRPSAVIGGKQEEHFLFAFDINVTAPRDPFVRVWISPLEKALLGWVNGELIYDRAENGIFWHHTYNPPLVPGHNHLVFRGRLGDFPTVNIRVLGHQGKTEFSA